MDIKPAELDWQALTPVSKQYADPYFSLVDGLAETQYVFLKHNGLPERWQDKSSFVIGETGFGTGLNFLVTANQWLKSRREGACLTYYSVEKYPLSQNDLAKSFENWPQFHAISNDLIRQYPATLPGFHTLQFKEERITLVLMFGDVLPMLRNMQSQVDCWYLDGFSPAKNPEMWSSAVCECIASLSHEETSFSTFTAAGSVRKNLQAAGFKVIKKPGFGTKREMLSGFFSGDVEKQKETQPWFSLTNLSSSKTKEVIIIGGGLAGLSCAWMLAEQGVRCTLFEAGDGLANGASGNVAGIVMPRFSLDMSLESEFYLSSFLFAISCLNTIKQKDNALCWQQTGVLQLATLQRIERIKKLGFAVSFLQGLTQREASNVAGVNLKSSAILFPTAGYVNPFQLCSTLARCANSLTLKTQVRINKLERVGDSWDVYDESLQLVARSKSIIFANGFDAQRILDLEDLNLTKSRGQVSQFPSSEDTTNLRMPVCHDGYMIPQINGSHVIGASYSAKDEGEHLSQQDHLDNLQGVDDILAAGLNVNRDTLQGRVSFRTTSLDHLPLVGPIPNKAAYVSSYKEMHHGRIHDVFPSAEYLPGLYLTTGHGSRGLVSCFSSAAYLTSLICGNPVTLSESICHRLHPARFIIRALRKSPNRRG